jgi:heme oxygenase
MRTAVEDLRHATHDLHQALEETQIAQDLLSPQLTLNRYAQILGHWARSWGALEASLDDALFAQSVGHLLCTPRAMLAQDDLRCLGYAATAPLPSFATTDSLRVDVPGNRSALLGRCYVMRGAALGGQVIARRVSASLGLQQNKGVYFFAHAQNESLGWPQWCKELESWLREPQERALAVQEARHTFAFLLQTFRAASAQQVGA